MNKYYNHLWWNIWLTNCGKYQFMHTYWTKRVSDRVAFYIIVIIGWNRVIETNLVVETYFKIAECHGFSCLCRLILYNTFSPLLHQNCTVFRAR